MAGGNFMQRVISYVVNEVVVNGLANRLLGLAHSKTVCSLKRKSLEASKLLCLQWEMPMQDWSPAFQRFAVRTSRKIEDVSKIAEKKRQELAEQVKEISKNMEESFKKQ